MTATPPKPEEYQCAMCGGTFAKTWSDDVALAECEKYFGKVPLEQQETVCDVCYQEINPAYHPLEVAKAKAELAGLADETAPKEKA